MGFLTKEGLQNLTNKLVQGDAIKVASHRGKNVKEVIDNIQRECESVALPNTMTLENRVNEFKVGQGRDVDVSSDVEEGKIEVGLEGKTWQNLVFNITKVIGTQNCDVEVLDLNNLSFEMTYKNDITGNTSNNRAVISSDLKTMIKPNTIYTFIYKYTLLENPKGQDCQLDIAIDMWGQNLANSKICRNVGFSDINITKATSLDLERLNTMASSINFINKRGQNTKWRIDGLIILEGDYTQTPIEELPKYFEGIKSSFEDGIVDVEVQGKNLISKATEWRLGGIDSNTGIYSDNPSGTRYTSNLIYNPSGKELYIRSKGHMWNYLHFYDENKNYLGFCTNQGMGGDYNFPINFDNSKRIAKYFSISFDNKDALEIGEVYEYRETDYIAPYKKKISFNIEESLRSLPNGVCDEIVGDKLVRRVGKIVFDGSQNINLLSHDSEHVRRWMPFTGKPKPKSNGKQINTFTSVEGTAKDTTKTNDFLGIDMNSNVVVGVQSSKLNTQDTEGFKQWLSKNPITVYYELAEPIITPIEPMKFNISQGAVININSNISPASTHKVILNRAGQIEQGIELIANLKSRINELENIYDSNLIATQYRIDNLKLNYELEREED